MSRLESFDPASSAQDTGGKNIVRPAPVHEAVVRRFTRGTEHPRGIVWFGATSFWGHLRHLFTAAIATENIDSRDWMTPDEPRALLARIADVLDGDSNAATLTEALGRDVYLDFVADTGDDVAVSRAVARLVFAPYELPNPDQPGGFLHVPRGDILLFGGDTAYPVATAQELMNRVIAPWNQVLRSLADNGGHRVLLGVPGNHDWYDGLDGFCRMFRRGGPESIGGSRVTQISRVPLEHHAEWAREFVRGGSVQKPKALVLSGYTAVQNASYFALPVAPNLDLLAVDRQITAPDPRQSEFLGGYYQSHPQAATFAVLPDPLYHFGEQSRTGSQMVDNLHLDLANRETFVLTGDIHHYERIERGKLLHVIAGGGGAFLHPARIAAGGLTPTVGWPNVRQSRLLLREVPWKLAFGRSGFLPHFSLLVLFAVAYVLSYHVYAHTGWVISVSVLTTLFIAGVYAFIGGVTRKPLVLPVALGAALITVLLPIGGSHVLHLVLERTGQSMLAVMLSFATIAIDVFVGAFVFGSYLALLTVLGYENMQAFTVLDHPGFKHFVRLRLRADGQGIDGWCIGAADPLGKDAKPVLVDHFSWRPFLQRQHYAALRCS